MVGGVVLLTEALTLGRLCQDWAPGRAPPWPPVPRREPCLPLSHPPQTPRRSEALDVRSGLECQQQAQGSVHRRGPLGACGDPGNSECPPRTCHGG